jgi:predicted nucleic acid-binding protein
MRANVLVDAGALIAILNRNDARHRRCTSVFPLLRIPLVTSEAVLAELFHLLGDSPAGMEKVWTLSSW